MQFMPCLSSMISLRNLSNPCVKAHQRWTVALFSVHTPTTLRCPNFPSVLWRHVSSGAGDSISAVSDLRTPSSGPSNLPPARPREPTLTSLVWPRPSNVHETWHHVPKSIVPEDWSNDWKTWPLTPLFGPSHDPREVELELIVAYELPRPIKPIMYSKRSRFCFVFQAGSQGGFYHWDDDAGTLHRIMAEPRTTVEEFSHGIRNWKINGPQSRPVSRTAAGQKKFEEIRREQHERDAETREQKGLSEQSNRTEFQFMNVIDDSIEISGSTVGGHRDEQMAGFNTHDDL